MKSSLTFQNQPVVELTQGSSRALFAPQSGARLLLWEVNGTQVILWPAQADWSKSAKIRGGNPILFPFVARHYVDGVIDKWRDASGTIRNMPAHGFCREARFEEISEDANSIRMRLHESETTLSYYPFQFQFDVIYRLTANSLEAEFAVSNTGEKALPYFAGHHFYFAIPHLERANWRLETPFARTGRQKPDGSIIEQPNTDASTALDRQEIVDRYLISPTAPSLSLKNSLTNRTIQFDLTVPGSVPWYAVTTWTENAESDFYCVEPWLGLPNAIHHQLGLRWVQPGQSERAICRLVLT